MCAGAARRKEGEGRETGRQPTTSSVNRRPRLSHDTELFASGSRYPPAGLHEGRSKSPQGSRFGNFSRLFQHSTHRKSWFRSKHAFSGHHSLANPPTQKEVVEPLAKDHSQATAFRLGLRCATYIPTNMQDLFFWGGANERTGEGCTSAFENVLQQYFSVDPPTRARP